HPRGSADQGKNPQSARALRPEWISVHHRSRDGRSDTGRALCADELGDGNRSRDGKTEDDRREEDVGGKKSRRHLSESRRWKESAAGGILGADGIVLRADEQSLH